MLKSGTKVCCPACGVRHIVRQNEVTPGGRVEMHCVSCGTTASIVEAPADRPHLAVEIRNDT